MFGEGKRLDDVTAQWLARFDAHQSNALTEIVNLILRATGSEREVEAADIEDVDHAPDRLTEIEEELKAVGDVCGWDRAMLTLHRRRLQTILS